MLKLRLCINKNAGLYTNLKRSRKWTDLGQPIKTIEKRFVYTKIQESLKFFAHFYHEKEIYKTFYSLLPKKILILFTSYGPNWESQQKKLKNFLYLLKNRKFLFFLHFIDQLEEHNKFLFLVAQKQNSFKLLYFIYQPRPCNKRI